jgi:hypothetical protein
MGVIPLRSDVHTATGAADCRLCAQSGTRARVALSAKQLRDVAPPVALVGAGILLALVDGGALAWIGAGVAAGVLSAAGYLWVRREKERREAHDAHALEMRASSEEADRRVELVIRQFEWAVNDVAKLRRDLGQAEATVQAMTERGRQREHQMEQLVRQISQLRERLAEVAMAASASEPTATGPVRSSAEAIRFSFGLHLDGPRARLELQTMASNDSPTRLRVMDRDGQIVAVSGMAVVSVDGMLEFQLEPPLDLIADLDEGRDINYAVEALADDVWLPVRLRDTGRRTHSVVDIKGQLSRAPDARDATRLIESAHERRTTLN